MGNKLSYPEVDLSGKVAVVTGGNTGIGYETAKALTRLGAHTFIACRSKERAEAAIERMKTELGAGGKKEVVPEGQKETTEGEDKGAEGAEKKDDKEGGAEEEVGKKDDGAQGGAEGAAEEKKEGEEKIEETPAGGETEAAAVKDKDGAAGEVETKPKKEVKVEFLPLDLSSFQSTTDFVGAFKEKDLPLHILINNAAVAWIPFRLTGDGYEEQFQVNHLGPLLLTLELLPVLLETAAASGDVRVVFVSSGAHKQALPFNAEQLVVKEELQYNRLRTYPNTKLYNVMVGYALQRRIQKKGITVSSLEPGYVKTELARGWEDKSILAFLNKIGYSAIARTPAEGAATTINCAVNPDLNTQECLYYASCKALPSNFQARYVRHFQARVENNQELLWEKSIEILKDHLSRDILDKYGEAHVEKPPAATTTPAAAETTPPAGKPADETIPPAVEKKSTEEAPPPADKPADETTPPTHKPTDKATPPADKPLDEATPPADKTT